MYLKLLRKAKQKKIKWSGGTTTQLYIFPEEAKYEKRNFLFRISTATVNLPSSVFTKLPNVLRTIMILDGEIKLEHDGKSTKILKKFSTDNFDGSIDTKGFGVCTDFNLMTTENYNGNIKSIVLHAAQNFKKIGFINEKFIGYYLLNGEVELSVFNKKILLCQQDFVLLRSKNKIEIISINANLHSEMVEVKITNSSK